MTRIRVRDTKELIGTDTTAPEAPVVSDVTDKDETISGIAEAGAKVVAEVSGQEIGSVFADLQGKFEITIEKQKAGNVISVTVIDGAGNRSLPAEIKVKDETPPAQPMVNDVTDASVVISGTVEAGAKVFAFVGGNVIGSAVAFGNGNFEIRISKQAAEALITVYAVDEAGNQSPTKEVVVMDATAPTIPSANSVTEHDEVIVGNAEAASSVVAKVDGEKIGAAIADQDGKFELKISKQTSGTKILITATDKAGIESRHLKSWSWIQQHLIHRLC